MCAVNHNVRRKNRKCHVCMHSTDLCVRCSKSSKLEQIRVQASTFTLMAFALAKQCTLCNCNEISAYGLLCFDVGAINNII